MNEKVIKLLLQLYIILSYSNKDLQLILVKFYVESHLKKSLSSFLVKRYMSYWEEYETKLSILNSDKNESIDYYVDQALEICKGINRFLDKKQRLLVLVNILELAKNWRTKDLDIIIDAIADFFKMPKVEYNDLRLFIYDELHKISDKKRLLYVCDKSTFKLSEINIFEKEGISGTFLVIYLHSTNTYLYKYEGKEELNQSGSIIFQNEVYIFEKGTLIAGDKLKISTLYYSEIVSSYVQAGLKSGVNFKVNNLEYSYPNSVNGIKKFSFNGYSGEMIGIMGGSGTGKTTLLSLLNGSIKPDNGEVLINGLSVIEDKDKLEGIIGYIPQDDLLIEDLSVYQNLYYNAKLSFSNLSNEEINLKVKETLEEFELWDFRDLKVGNPLNKFISGGQRKRLNVAIEIIRRSSVIFIDEPTSGLSSADSERVMELLKTEALKGSFMIVNIHQPSSNIFKQFDKIIILDKGGYVIYIGDPVEAIGYFRHHALELEDLGSLCYNCKTVLPDLIFDFVEQKVIDEYGEFTNKRKILPADWYKIFWDKEEYKLEEKQKEKALPDSITKRPSYIQQFKIFFNRNLRSKISDKQYILTSTLVTPFLAIVLSFIVRYLHNTDGDKSKYVFYYNENIPAFILMSIIVALFIGLIISAEEIYHDRKIRQREKFLNLSWGSYINSKIVFLLLLSALQAFVYGVIGIAVLGINHYLFPFWLILFSLFSFGNLVGLNISATLKSVVAIYIVIPIILVPQILLCGVIVRFDKLHPLITSEEVVPLFGDFMVSRWAYEGLLVEQFKNNEFNKYFFDVEKQISDYSYVLNYLLPELIDYTKNIKVNMNNQQYTVPALELLSNETDKLIDEYNFPKPDFINELEYSSISHKEINEIELYLVSMKKAFVKALQAAIKQKDDIFFGLTQKYGKEGVDDLMKKNSNQKVSDFVLNNTELRKKVTEKNRIIRLYEPVYNTPKSKIGRAHFFAPYKRIGAVQIETFWFNILVIWLFNAILYIIIVTNFLNKIIYKYKKR